MRSAFDDLRPALVLAREAEQLAPRAGEPAPPRDVAEPLRQLSVVLTAVELPPIAIGHHWNSASIPARTKRGRRERREQEELCQLFARRYPRELGLDEVEAVFDREEVGAREVDLAQRERVFIWHTHGMPENGLWLLA
jgi:hypothetical protein